jgi:hypothetical protein
MGGVDLGNQIIQQVLDPLRSESARGSGKLSFVKSLSAETDSPDEFDGRGTSGNVLIRPVVFPVGEVMANTIAK